MSMSARKRSFLMLFLILVIILCTVNPTTGDPESEMMVFVQGNNNYDQVNVPAPNKDFIAIAAGHDHILGLKSNGSIVAWGNNESGQINVPPPNESFTAISAGRDHSLGLKTDGSIVSWGKNDNGQCDVPVPNDDFIGLDGGLWHSLGLKTDGSIVAWGANGSGQCGVPSPNEDFTAVAAGYLHSLGLKTDGSIVAWGNNDDGQCDVPLPNENFIAVAAGSYHSLGLKADGSIVAWGRHPTVLVPNSDITAIAASGAESYVLKSNGSIFGWGCGDSGGLCEPIHVPNSNFTALATGDINALGIRRSYYPVAVAEVSETLILTGENTFVHPFSSYDIDGSIASCFWDFGDGFTSTNFEEMHAYTDPGSYVITLTVTDIDGMTASDEVSVEVFADDEMVQYLQEEVLSLDLPRGIEQGLMSKLNAAIASLERGNERSAANQLNAFINMVGAQRGKALTDDQAESLIALAERIIDSLRGM